VCICNQHLNRAAIQVRRTTPNLPGSSDNLGKEPQRFITKKRALGTVCCYSGLPNFGFSLLDVNLMECQILWLLDWDVGVRNEDLYQYLEPFLGPIFEKVKLFKE
jgi:hypothetical protein